MSDRAAGIAGRNWVAIFAIIAAVVLAVADKPGWGWMIVLAVVCYA